MISMSFLVGGRIRCYQLFQKLCPPPLPQPPLRHPNPPLNDVLTFRGQITPQGMSGLYGVHGRDAPLDRGAHEPIKHEAEVGCVGACTQPASAAAYQLNVSARHFPGISGCIH
jgi:hypothetical protein